MMDLEIENAFFQYQQFSIITSYPLLKKLSLPNMMTRNEKQVGTAGGLTTQLTN